MKLDYTPSLLMLAVSLLLVENHTMVSAFSTSQKILEVQQKQFAASLTSHHSYGLPQQQKHQQQKAAFIHRSSVVLSHAPTSSSTTTTSTATAGDFIGTELRGAAMRLHTRAQAPKEGQAEVNQDAPKEKYVTTQADYLQFLVDSQHVYQALEAIVDSHEELAVYRNTGLERVTSLETDIGFMMQEYTLERPPVGAFGTAYAQLLEGIAGRGPPAIPEFMCHYYNFYFAHTAGGRMIGKQMSALLLNKKTLEFYKWDGDLNEIKGRVKESIEEMAAGWSQDEKDQCVGATADAFKFGGGINAYLSGGKSPH